MNAANLKPMWSGDQVLSHAEKYFWATRTRLVVDRMGIMRRWHRALLVFIVVLASGVAQAGDATAELLRARLEHWREDPSVTLRGVTLAAGEPLMTLYARRGFTRAWVDPAPRAQLLHAIRDSRDDGLDPEDYLLTPLEVLEGELARGATVDAVVDRDLLMTEALARLMFHVMFGKVDPMAFDPQWNFARTVHHNDPAAFLQDLIASGDVLAAVEREKPQFEMYAHLREALARYRGIEARGGWPGLATGPTLTAGMRDARVITLRSRLAAAGELEAGQVSDAELFDPPLEAALRDFQARHGLATDGALGPATLAALNVPVSDRITQVRVNLERGRWLLHELDPTFVVVNVAGFQVYYIRDGQLAWTAHTVVGKPFRKTPLFRARIQYIVFNPTWTVPSDILAKDILPAVRRDPGYLARKRIDVVDRSGRVVPADSVDWNAKTIPHQLVQRSGADNALGVVKFMFPNTYSVYLHDTPSKELFQEADRAFSSGCIRVEKPLELAELLLQGQPGWDRAGIDAVVQRGTTRTVSLAKPVPVLLTYWTAWVEASGTLQFRKDVYGRDAAIAQALANRFDADDAQRRVSAALAH